MSVILRRDTLVLFGLCAVVAVMILPARAEVLKPSCEAAESWALTIDAKNRWNPVPGQKRFWLPSAFDGPGFEALFGAAVTDWTLDDVNAVRPLLQSCAQAARKAKRADAQKALNAARAFVSGAIKNHIVQTARAGERLDRNLDALFDLPDSPQLMQMLALLRDLKPGDRNALRESGRRIARIGGAESKAARQVLVTADRQTPEAYVADTLPRIDARYHDLSAAAIEQAEDRLAEHPSGPQGLAAIDATLADVRATYDFALGPEEYARLEAVAEAERTSLRQEILDEAKARIDALATAPESIATATAIVADVAPSLDADTNAALESHAASRRHALADALLADAEAALDGFPETLDGIDGLDRHVADTLGIASGPLDDARLDGFRATADARRDAMAAAALPEFENRIAALGDDDAGLRALAAETAKAESWKGIAPETRAAYGDAAARRKVAMETAIAAAAAERERERQFGVVRATKARIDAMDVRFRSFERIAAEVADARRKHLDAPAMTEIETHAAARRRTIADGILDLAIPKLAQVPETFVGLGEQARLADTVIEETKADATPDALAAFEAKASEAAGDLGRRLLGAFEDQIAALNADREGLANVSQAVEWAEGWRHVDPGVRDAYLEAARERRDAIAAVLDAAEAERREKVLAAGGDPDLVGYTFADGNGLSSLEFADEKHVIFAMLGMRFGGTYEIVKDDIFVQGPNGTVVFARDGEKLSGMGLNLKRVDP